MGATPLGDLYRNAADAAGGTVNEQSLVRLQIGAAVGGKHSVPCGQHDIGERSGLDMAQLLGFLCQSKRIDGRVVGEGAMRRGIRLTIYGITHPEVMDPSADRFDDAGNIAS